MNQPQQHQDNVSKEYSLKNSAHPGLITWDLIFKGLPIGLYFFSFFLPNALIIRLSCITIISAIEFWFTKNVLGRVLVGLKWSRVVQDNGEEHLIYETKRSEDASNRVDYNAFWGLLIIAFGIWLYHQYYQVQIYIVFINVQKNNKKMQEYLLENNNKKHNKE